MNTPIISWADLDASNAKHYGRGKPEYVIEAQSKMQDASKMYDEYSELWERGYVSGDELAEVFEEYLSYVAQYEQAYAKWQAELRAEFTKAHDDYMYNGASWQTVLEAKANQNQAGE